MCYVAGRLHATQVVWCTISSHNSALWSLHVAASLYFIFALLPETIAPEDASVAACFRAGGPATSCNATLHTSFSSRRSDAPGSMSTSDGPLFPNEPPSLHFPSPRPPGLPDYFFLTYPSLCRLLPLAGIVRELGAAPEPPFSSSLASLSSSSR